jgi:hypothetical protein
VRREVGEPLGGQVAQGPVDAELTIAAASKDEIEERDRRTEFLKAMEQFNWPAPEGYRFEREEANER